MTEEELKLVEIKDTNYFKTFLWETQMWINPDVDKAEMKLSESDSKFVEGWGRRHTTTIKNYSSQKQHDCSLQ